jgi:hypothetical protein
VKDLLFQGYLPEIVNLVFPDANGKKKKEREAKEKRK